MSFGFVPNRSPDTQEAELRAATQKRCHIRPLTASKAKPAQQRIAAIEQVRRDLWALGLRHTQLSWGGSSHAGTVLTTQGQRCAQHNVEHSVREAAAFCPLRLGSVAKNAVPKT